MLGFCLIEPRRAAIDATDAKDGAADRRPNRSATSDGSGSLLRQDHANHRAIPAALLLLGVFVGANFVAATFLSWLPMFIFELSSWTLSFVGFTSTVWPLASLPGAVLGGVVADWAVKRWRGGRIGVQGAGLILAAPFVFLTGWSIIGPMLIAALIGAGFCKGIYDANIFASLFDVVRPEDRGTAAGLMNTVGWSGGVRGAAADRQRLVERFGLGVAITATAAVYLLVGLLALVAARRLARERGRSTRGRRSKLADLFIVIKGAGR